MKTQATLAELLQAFFTEWLMGQRNASPHTIANYRDTFRLLLAFGCRGRGLKKTPAALSVQDLDAPLIVRFLDHLEKQRNNTPQSRNVRLAAIHSFFQYVALREPGLGAVAQRVLAIPSKRLHQEAGGLPEPSRNRGFAKSPGSEHMVRSAGPRVVATGEIEWMQTWRFRMGSSSSGFSSTDSLKIFLPSSPV